jgi:hypothetical protein
MVDSNSDPYEAADAPLREKEGRLIAELEAVRQSRAAIAAARVAAGRETDTAKPTGIVSPAMLPALSEPQLNKFKGMGLETAAAKYLSESDQIELTARQVWNALAASGFTILSDRPEQSVSWALRKREKKVGDVILIGDGKWGMVAWYSKDRVRDIRAKRTNASGRNHAEHVEKTKAGIANARNTRLNEWGPRRKITAEQMAKAYYAIQNGARSKLEAAKAGDMVWPTFNFYWCYFEMEDWKPGKPFPPTRRAIAKKGRDIRFEEMWAPENKRPNGHAKDSGPQLELQPAE